MTKAELVRDIATKVGIGTSAARNRVNTWHPLRWYEPPQAHASGVNHSRPASAGHPWKRRMLPIRLPRERHLTAGRDR